MTVIGWIAFFFVSIFLSDKPINCDKFGPCYYVFFGEDWGGLSLGTNFILSKMDEEYLDHCVEHECGHTFQNAIFGPFAIFLIFIPSYIRYWYKTIRMNRGKENKDYDAIWFEGSASTVGNCYHEYLKHKAR